MARPRFFIKRIYLDNVFNRSTADHTLHWVGSSFKAFAVVDCKDSNFKLTLTPDATDRSVEGYPLQSGAWHNFTVLPDNACFENSIPQPGVWVDVLISTEDSLTAGKIQAIVTNRSINFEGSTSPQSKVTIGTTAAVLLDADDTRIIASFQFKSGTGKVYVGTPAELADADFANICHHVEAGDDFVIPGSGGHSAKAVGGTNIYALRKGIQ